MRVPSGSTDRYLYFVAVDATDLKTRETGLNTFTVYRSRNGAAAAAFTTPTVNETDATNMPGVYELLLDEDTTLDAGKDEQEVVVHITHAGMAPVSRTFELYRPKATEGETLGVSSGALSSLATAALAAIADKLLGRSIAGGADGGRTVTSALRALRNKFTIVGTTYTAHEEDDSTPAWTGTVSKDANAEPITGNDPT